MTPVGAVFLARIELIHITRHTGYMVLNRREQAEKLRRRGYSYNLISQRLLIGKGTLSYWLRKVPYVPNKLVKRRISSGPIISAARRHQAKVDAIQATEESGRKEIGRLTMRDLWILGIGLYLGEGSKTHEHVRLINSDPEIIRLAIRWFRRICRVRTDNITIAIHIYPDIDIQEAERFWRKVTGLPRRCFRKIQIDRRTNKDPLRRRTLAHGTAHIAIIGAGNLEFGVQLFRRISGWMAAALNAGMV